MVAIIQPGVGKGGGQQTTSEKRNITTADTLMDLVRNLIPPNIIQATLQQQVTSVTYDASNSNHTFSDKTTWDFETSFQDNTNILGLIDCLVFGVWSWYSSCWSTSQTSGWLFLGHGRSYHENDYVDNLCRSSWHYIFDCWTNYSNEESCRNFWTNCSILWNRHRRSFHSWTYCVTDNLW